MEDKKITENDIEIRDLDKEDNVSEDNISSKAKNNKVKKLIKNIAMFLMGFTIPLALLFAYTDIKDSVKKVQNEKIDRTLTKEQIRLYTMDNYGSYVNSVDIEITFNDKTNDDADYKYRYYRDRNEIMGNYHDLDFSTLVHQDISFQYMNCIFECFLDTKKEYPEYTIFNDVACYEFKREVSYDIITDLLGVDALFNDYTGFYTKYAMDNVEYSFIISKSFKPIAIYHIGEDYTFSYYFEE